MVSYVAAKCKYRKNCIAPNRSALPYGNLVAQTGFGDQSSGGVSTPQTFPGSSSARPMSQNFSYSAREMQFTTRAVTVRLAGRPSNRTWVPIFSGRPNLTPHPCGFASIAKHGSKKGWAESRLIRVSRISQGILVPRRRLAVGRFFPSKKSASRGIAITPRFVSANSENPRLPDRRERLDRAEMLWPFLTEPCLISGQRIVSFEAPFPNPYCPITYRDS